MDSDKQIYWTFADHITDVLDSVSMDNERQALFKLGKYYATSEETNAEIDAAGFAALKKVAVTAYQMATRSYDDEENNDE